MIYGYFQSALYTLIYRVVHNGACVAVLLKKNDIDQETLETMSH